MEKPQKILIIDDDNDFRYMLSKTISRAGYEVFEATNGIKGLEIYQANQIDLVITDIFMPEKEGIETVVDLKEINPEVKIIVISGGGTKIMDVSYLDNMLDFGAQRAFEKPFRSSELIAAIEEILD